MRVEQRFDGEGEGVKKGVPEEKGVQREEPARVKALKTEDA